MKFICKFEDWQTLLTNIGQKKAYQAKSRYKKIT